MVPVGDDHVVNGQMRFERAHRSLRLLERVCQAVPLPVNFMAFPGAPSTHDVAATGIARISHGPFPHMLAMKAFEDAARAAFSR